MAKTKEILFKIKMNGRGIVNYDSQDQKFFLMKRCEYPVSLKNDNLKLGKKSFHQYADENGEVKCTFNAKISSNCLRHSIFEKDAWIFNPKVTIDENILSYFISSFVGITRGYALLTKEKNSLVRASALLPQIRAQRKVTENMVYSGLWLVMVGLVKKAVVADYLAQYNNLVFSMPSGYSGFECLMGVLGYSIQIFCDFSGYSDIAIGIARIMGFDLGINFRSPYKSLNMTEFWRRWHISLSSWLKDYVYIPLGGNRKGRLRTYVNLMVTMLIGGIWHGAGWNFIVWGGMHGVGLVVHKFCKSRFDSVSNLFTMCLSWAITFSFVTALWIFFRSPDFAGAMEMIGSIVADFRAEMIVPFLSARIGWVNVFLLSVIAVFLQERLYGRVESWFISSKLWVKIIVFISVVQLILEFSGSEVSPFIYFQF